MGSQGDHLAKDRHSHDADRRKMAKREGVPNVIGGIPLKSMRCGGYRVRYGAISRGFVHFNDMLSCSLACCLGLSWRLLGLCAL